jgi:hypothetical protein
MALEYPAVPPRTWSMSLTNARHGPSLMSEFMDS